MRNTGIRYNSKERMPTVLSEMAELLPPLSGEQLAVLEADLLANGCYAPVIVNEDIPGKVSEKFDRKRRFSDIDALFRQEDACNEAAGKAA